MSDTNRAKTVKVLVITITMLVLMMLTYYKLLRTPTQRDWSEVEGQVLKKDTRVPIEGALVVARYRGTGFDASQCFNIEMTRTTAKGVYKIPAWTNQGSSASLGNQHMYVYIHSPGFKREATIVYPRQLGKTIYMKRFNGTREEYMEQLRWLASAASCHDRSMASGAIANALRTEQRIVEAIHREAMSVLGDQEELTRLERIYLSSIEHHLARKIVLLELEESGKKFSIDVYEERIQKVLQDGF